MMILQEEIKLDYDDIIVKVEDRVRKELKENNYKEDMFGYVHFLENRKKEILENEYGIKIKTKQEQNPSSSMD